MPIPAFHRLEIGGAMRQVRLTFAELALIAGTRAAAGAGLALLLGERLKPDQRRAVGWALLAVGAISTVPLLIEVFGQRPGETSDES